jgi:hypothetical protein
MSELICFDDCDEFMSETDDPIAEWKQDSYHRLFDEPGSNLDDPNRGLGLKSRLNGTGVKGLDSAIIAELLKDDRTQSCTCTITPKPGVRDQYRIAAECTGDLGSLSLGLDVAGTTVTRAA